MDHGKLRIELVEDLRRRLDGEPDSRAAAALARTISLLLDRVDEPAVAADPISELEALRQRRRGRAAG